MAHLRFIEQTISKFKKELGYYTVSGVQNTAQHGSVTGKSSWTEILLMYMKVT